MKNGFRNWSDVAVFLAVCRCGSTLAASKALAMSQPTVARRIDALEHELGLTLFERDTRGFRPTADSERLLPVAETIEAAAQAFGAEADKARKTSTRPIRITAPRRNFSSAFSAILAEFSAEHPGTRFEFISTYEVLDLFAGEADVAIRIAPRVLDDRLICVRLTEATNSLYASRAYADRYGLPASPAEFPGHRFVIYDPLPGSGLMTRWLVDRISPDQIVSRCGDPEGVTAAIEAGLGIGPVSTTFALDYPTLVRCFPPPEGTSLTSWLVIAPDAYRRPEVKAFAAFFAPRFREAYLEQRARAEAQATYRPRGQNGIGSP